MIDLETAIHVSIKCRICEEKNAKLGGLPHVLPNTVEAWVSIDLDPYGKDLTVAQAAWQCANLMEQHIKENHKK